MTYARIRDMMLVDRIERLRFEKSKEIAERQRLTDSIKHKNSRIGKLIERLYNEEVANRQNKTCTIHTRENKR